MSLGVRLSGLGASLGVLLEPVIRLARPDLGRELTARRAVAAELERWAEHRSGGSVVWLHGASAGELLGAVPTIEALGARHEFDLLVTHFSPSGRSALEWLSPAHAGYPPLERPRDCRRAIEAVRPALLLFAKLDVWPGLVAAASGAGVPMALINGTVREASGRLGRGSRRLFQPTYEALDFVGAAREEDARRLRRLGVLPARLEVTGDAAFDLALARADRAQRSEGLRTRFEAALPDRPPGGVRLVAGSTWPEDETALLSAVETMDDSPSGRRVCQVVLAPHEPDEPHVHRLVEECRSRGRPVERLSRLAEPKIFPSHGVIVIDEVGRLAEWYTAADVAFVGGGLGGTGLHNVLEPAAAGIPVLFGDRHDRGDAVELERAGGGLSGPEDVLPGHLIGLLDAERRTSIGARARAYVESGAGAALRTVAALESIWPAED